MVSRECLTGNVDPLCLTNRTINQELSMKQHGCRTREGKECVAEVWKNVRGEWYQVLTYVLRGPPKMLNGRNELNGI